MPQHVHRDVLTGSFFSVEVGWINECVEQTPGLRGSTVDLFTPGSFWMTTTRVPDEDSG